MGDKEWFFGATALELERANQAFDEGRYQDALEAYLEAQRLHGEPSIIIQGLIGSSYRALGQPETAIQHFTNALELKDDPINRVEQWDLNLATTIWGEHPEAMEWYYRETFEETCGTVMQ